MQAVIDAFLLGFPALISIVNPLSGAFIFRDVTAGRSIAQRAGLARLIGIYSFAVMLGALWVGGAILTFFGVSIAALRIGGGLVVALNAWGLLNAPEQREARRQQHAPTDADDTPDEALSALAFFPLTMPITTGPGTIAVAITLGSAHATGVAHGVWLDRLGLSAASACVAVLVWVSYRFADLVARQMGPAGSRIIGRLAAFLLLCIGVQILIVGVQGVFTPLLGRAG
ncbi:MAG: NAAT family transporter [Rhodospirillales bacterium]|nr:NAAT family transporter [Rhodospirillales bacterium]